VAKLFSIKLTRTEKGQLEKLLYEGAKGLSVNLRSILSQGAASRTVSLSGPIS
jgi:hypothetical protein